MAAAWSAYPEDMLLFGINLLLVVLWSYSAWLDAECRRIQRDIDRIKRMEDEP